ncbi:MAG TPA: hypothetical protein PLP21_09685 [Pyrinomonadaceae bacterium]|nr:hypothetical protein [Acidobacteriota bacterium]HQZ96578.1 hypothetical protein [Pyrinomonadaceae bacterium]
MNTTKHTLDFTARPKLRLSEVARLIRINRIIIPPLSRRKLVAMCEDGTLEHAPRQTSRDHYLIYEDSFLKWIREMDGE